MGFSHNCKRLFHRLLTPGSLAMAENTRQTFRYDRLRAAATGILDSASATFLLLIAVQILHADALSKSLIAAGSNIGLLLTLWLVPTAERLGLPVARIAGVFYALGGMLFLTAAAFPAPGVFVPATVLAMALNNLAIPLLTQIYQSNYPARERGRLVSSALMIRVTVAALAGVLGGWLLNSNSQTFRLLLAAFGLSLLWSAFTVHRMPSPVLPRQGHSPLHAMRHIRTDRTLRLTLLAWMLMGFANLMMLPLRVEFLANPRYGITLDSAQIAMYTTIVPSIVRIALTPVWGRLFDRMNFFVLRIVLNIGFALGTAAFFFGISTPGLLAGAVVFGASAAGGEIAWSLWVTKFSPPEQVAEYMSVHTFFTGLRGVLAPLLAFQLIEHLPIATLGLICAGMIVLASLVLVPEMRGKKSS
jgi:MFS family permease